MSTISLPGTVVIGGANLDVAGSSTYRLIPGDSNPGVIRTGAGGVGRNIAENLARLGFQCTLLTALGDDLGKKIIISACEEVGIDMSHVRIDPDCATGSYIAVNNQLGALLAAISDMDIIEQISPEWLEKKRSTILAHKQIVAEANLETDALEWIAANRDGRPLLVDAVSATKAVKLKNILSDIDLLKVNRDEASAILDTQAPDADLAMMLLQEKGVKNVLLSQGPQGAIFLNHDGMSHKAAIKGNNICDTGAGDALLAGFISAQHILKQPAAQLEFAISCATFTLNSLHSVNPLISVQAIKEQYLHHLPKGAWNQ